MDLKLKYAFFLAGEPVGNVDLWRFAEDGLIERGVVIKNEASDIMKWSGHAFHHNENDDVWFSKCDVWTYVGVDKDYLKNERLDK